MAKITIDIAFLTKAKRWTLDDLADIAESKFKLKTISEEKLLMEIVNKRDMFNISPDMFLRDRQRNADFVKEQIDFLIQKTSL